jgi:hypothetical protein
MLLRKSRLVFSRKACQDLRDSWLGDFFDLIRDPHTRLTEFQDACKVNRCRYEN